MHKNTTLLMTFTRNPELGKVKSRLAKGIGEKAALEVYIKLLEHTESVLQKVNTDKCVWYSVSVRENDLWNDDVYQKKTQVGTDLGARMLYAFQDAFDNNYEKVMIIGSDLYDLQPKHIEEAIKALDTNDMVFGPAQDGGYYLLGMKTLHEKAFLPKNWGTETVLADTLNDLDNQTIHFLETLNDIDHAEDLVPYDAFKKYLH
ncbi:TIGR04282 family arsenosugar biosynthesis glycosyltransferase [Kordia sp. YSTF-M3]|uniref:TIGR04282 family arsenosugar biosynthesis glycosyltransferase n=1 Tax=Kordia aestuariivivens TaxID=2759037 RepID=A0ABR7QA65_9FLAO|nr:TIGR04282 family arsenosugar biosynthesis glycosyltransferase [Kordia aestuariivivens]MBC8755454.1 TIGR04282 family arsenosugar biosynthesis glycosyltransferase [Kordia aestuariivivens]